jgi:ubiquinone/menaquinone biosynthesis C-methylase UbiE
MWFYHIPHWLRAPFVRIWYAGVSVLDREADMVFMNYGWAAADGDARSLHLAPEDEPNRYCIQLYHRVAGAVDLAGRDVLEVGCGRGGGASFVMRYLKPRTLTGVDLTARAIAFCRKHYDTPGLTFVHGDAEALEFDESTFDAVINVESSHCYGAVDKFLAQVHRVLKPGGHLLYADTRSRADVPRLRLQLERSGLEVIEEELLNAAVVRALELDSVRKQALIQTRVPRLLRPFLTRWAGTAKRAPAKELLRHGEKQYLRFVLQKG